MTKEKEIVISLTKLIVPESIKEVKIILSVQFQHHQLFIQKERILKDHRVNLFRECLFLSSIPDKIAFRIYSVSDSGQRTLLKTLDVEDDDVRSINYQSTSMKASKHGFQVYWQAWIFSEQSDHLSFLTDRNYSQLDIPFKNEDEQTFIEGSNNSTNIQCGSQPFCSAMNLLKKQSQAIHSSLFPEIDLRFAKSIHETGNQNCQSLLKHFNSMKPSEKNHIQYNLYRKVIQDITDLIFSQKKKK